MTDRSMSVKFWGVRASIPCPGPATVRYGGHTSCVEVRCGERLIVLDAGSGIRELARHLAQTPAPVNADLLVSHCHIDHVLGLPFVEQLYDPRHTVRIHAGGMAANGGIRTAIARLMSAPLFPVNTEAFSSGVTFHDFAPGESFALGDDIRVRTTALRHPDGATGYRIDYAGRAVTYLTDIELGDDVFDRAARELAAGASLLIMDSTYTDDELTSHRGWGHSSWQQAANFADAAGVATLCLFHHDPEHTDPVLDGIAREAVARRPNTVTAREGLRIDL